MKKAIFILGVLSSVFACCKKHEKDYRFDQYDGDILSSYHEGDTLIFYEVNTSDTFEVVVTEVKCGLTNKPDTNAIELSDETFLCGDVPYRVEYAEVVFGNNMGGIRVNKTRNEDSQEVAIHFALRKVEILVGEFGGFGFEKLFSETVNVGSNTYSNCSIMKSNEEDLIYNIEYGIVSLIRNRGDNIILLDRF